MQVKIFLLFASLIFPPFMKKARWFIKAAEGGYVRAMYNLSLCYSCGEGLVHNHQQAKKWMKRAADRGHCKAQFEHGLHLFSVRFFLLQ